MPIDVYFQSLEIGDRITQKVTLRVAKTQSLMDMATQLRAFAVECDNVDAAQQWARTTWMPHVSLLYADTQIGENERLGIGKIIREYEVPLDEHPKESIEPTNASWTGAQVWWVDTRGEIANWKILGKRDLKILKN